MKRILGLFVAGLQFVRLGSAALAPELPVETFFRDYEFGEAEISPDGKCLALIAPSKGKRNLLVIDLEKHEPKWLTDFADRNVHDITWVGDERLVLRMEKDGFETGGMFAINRDRSKQAILVSTAEFRAELGSWHYYHAELLNLLPDDPAHVLVEANDFDGYSSRDAGMFPDVEIMDAFTGRHMPVEKNPGNITDWFADNQGVIRAAEALEGEKARVLYRTDAKGEWQTIAEFPVAEPFIEPLRFAPDNTNLYVFASNGRKATGLYLFDVARRQLGECLWQHAAYDAGAVAFSRKTHRPLYLLYDDVKPQCQWFDAKWLAIQAGIDKALPDTINRVINVSWDETKAVFHAFNDRTMGTLYLYDAATRRLERLREKASWIKPEQMAEMKPITYQARDGLTIHGYLTLPLGSTGTNLPLVIFPHGGPWVRDTWEFNPDVQFLANRGYAVLQANFRGSAGYGFAFLKAGFRQWGLKMQDDLTDGVNWAIARGIATPRRVCIYGASYGGYAAMAGLTQTPELYRCGINYAGVTDIVTLLRADAYRMPRNMAFLYHSVGRTKEDREALEAASPIHHVDKLQAPLLLIYGGDDPRVRESQGKRLAKALKDQKKPFELIFEEREGHGFHVEKNKIEMYRQMDAFLKKHL